jgi:hypothetical protein
MPLTSDRPIANSHATEPETQLKPVTTCSAGYRRIIERWLWCVVDEPSAANASALSALLKLFLGLHQ